MGRNTYMMCLVKPWANKNMEVVGIEGPEPKMSNMPVFSSDIEVLENHTKWQQLYWAAGDVLAWSSCSLHACIDAMTYQRICFNE